MASAEGVSVLLAGESWVMHTTHIKGFSDFTTGHYEEGHAPLRAALEGAGCAFSFLPNHLAAEEFPASAAELGAYDVVILSDISADTLLLHPKTFTGGERTPNRLRVICDYVRDGGGFLMVGGYMSFSGIGGQAAYHFSPITDVLPVGLTGVDDRVETPEGVVPQPAAEHPILDGIDGEWPWFLGYNKLTTIEDGQVLVRIGDDPFLAVRQVVAGRTAAFASDCAPHWGSPAFLEWPHYGRLWSQLVAWLAGR